MGASVPGQLQERDQMFGSHRSGPIALVSEAARPDEPDPDGRSRAQPGSPILVKLRVCTKVRITHCEPLEQPERQRQAQQRNLEVERRQRSHTVAGDGDDLGAPPAGYPGPDRAVETVLIYSPFLFETAE